MKRICVFCGSSQGSRPEYHHPVPTLDSRVCQCIMLTLNREETPHATPCDAAPLYPARNRENQRKPGATSGQNSRIISPALVVRMATSLMIFCWVRGYFTLSAGTIWML